MNLLVYQLSYELWVINLWTLSVMMPAMILFYQGSN